MSARLNKAQKEEVRQKIVEEGFRLFSEKGYDGTTTKEIARCAGIAEGTIFNYFPSKEYLFIECMAEKYKLLEKKLPQPEPITAGIVDMIYDFIVSTIKGPTGMPKSFLREMAHILTYFSKKRIKMLNKLFELDYKSIENLEEILQEAVEKGLIYPVDVSVASNAIYSVAMYEVLNYIYIDTYDQEEMKKNFRKKLEFLLKGWVVE
ncbi:MAG TPA: TetR/AcrR family transcriptional regulator [Thermotogota bacterium]|nr:TetR/AcrR family transcriptional regulator [Thermotogota bacterium]HPJ88609.1 TetR/AcrR family transcriptional regulator [Thermotogota bacterium]HPR96651.1 TetR/AcrR family transcriptional regulator [Thermotogota bacterium]